MSIKIKLTLYFVAPWLLTQPISKVQQGPSHVAINTFSRVNGVPYAQGVSAPLLADIYLPNSKRLTPAIVFIHGGGWIHGTRGGAVIDPLVEQGYAGMAIDYDLSPGVRFPVALEECKAAVRWLRAHAAEYRIDPNRIAVEGGSAGGELAALVALTGDDPGTRDSGVFTHSAPA